MKDLTYDVRVYKTYVYKGRRGNTYRVRGDSTRPA